MGVLSADINLETATLGAALAGVGNHALHGKLHNPNYSESAVAELTKMSQAMTEGMKKKAFETPEAVEAFRNSWDWNKITEQDEAVWDKIFNFIEE